MGEGVFQANSGNLENTGSSTTTSGEAFQQHVSDFRTSCTNIEQAWVGEDAQAFQQVAKELATLLDQASETVQAVGKRLSDTGTAIGEAAAAGASRINSHMG